MYTPRKLVWDNALTTGDQELDAQHRFLIDTFNDLGDAIQQGLGTETISRILGVLKFYAGWHFGREEDCMHTYQCPAAEINKRAHMVFVEKFTAYAIQFEKSGGDINLALKIHEELSDWIVKHILAVDGQLYACIHKKQKPTE